MRRRPRHIRVRSGQFELVKLNVKKFDLRDTYHLILNLSWPGFAGLVFGIYFLINVAFASLYMLNPHAVAEMRPGSFFDAFFFSVETLATVIVAPVQSFGDYNYDQIEWNRRFVEIYDRNEEGEWTVDYARIDETEDITPIQNLAKGQKEVSV